jgi:hypothetical protein
VSFTRQRHLSFAVGKDPTGYLLFCEFGYQVVLDHPSMKMPLNIPITTTTTVTTKPQKIAISETLLARAIASREIVP